jgi:hypothetical protein
MRHTVMRSGHRCDELRGAYDQRDRARLCSVVFTRKWSSRVRPHRGPAQVSTPRHRAADDRAVKSGGDHLAVAEPSPNSTKTPRKRQAAWPRHSPASSPSGPSPTPLYRTARPASPSNRPRSTPFATSHNTGTRRSIETTSTPRSKRSTPVARTTHRTGSAPPRHHLRRRVPSHSPARAPGRVGTRRTSESSSRSQTPPRSARPPPSRCPLPAASAAHDAAATPASQAARAHAEPRSPSELRLRCVGRGTASGECGDRE